MCVVCLDLPSQPTFKRASSLYVSWNSPGPTPLPSKCRLHPSTNHHNHLTQ